MLCIVFDDFIFLMIYYSS